MKPSEQPPFQSKSYRIITFAFGVLFAGIAITLFFVAEISLGSVAAGIVLGWLGLDAIFSAIGNKISLLSKIGPLP